MRSFQEILAIAAERKGGVDAVLNTIEPPLGDAALSQIPDDRWLSMMTKCVFRAGFNWKVIENKWDGFEAAFERFSIGRCIFMDDDWLSELVSDQRIVRNGQKILSVQRNAAFVGERASGSGGFGAFVAQWPVDNFVGLIDVLKTEGSRLGGTTGQYFLRSMGKESFILSRDVTARLVAEGVVDKPPTSKRAMQNVQAAFNEWQNESGQSLNVISRVLAQSTG